MANSNLSATTASGTQNTTQDPQTAGMSTGAGTPSSEVQQGTPTSTLDANTPGVPLTNPKLTSINLASSSTSGASNNDIPQHYTNPSITGISLLFFLVAIALLISFFIPVKNTTE